MSEWLFSREDAERSLPDKAIAMRFAETFGHGSMRLGLYAPRGSDTQTPHAQDELYVVVAGTGRFTKNGEERSFAPNDVIFVEAGADLRFLDFSPDFAAWAGLWGPCGGE